MQQIFLVFCLALTLNACSSVQETASVPSIEAKEPFAQDFLDIGLQTNTAKSLIPLGDILNGGPKKDGIPALKNPRFITINQADWLEDDSRGMLLTSDKEVRFYPYDVLYWHEIVNDKFEGQSIAVTFCPLCGSAIVYDREVEEEVLTFGVSGKLWQSNLLMYDTATESLWSQIEGKAMVGEKVGTPLTLIESDVVFFKDVKAFFPEAKILSKQTGYRRPYGSNPYGSYESDMDLYFPIDHPSESFHPKTIFIGGTYQEINFALHRKDLLDTGQVAFSISGKDLVAKVGNDGTITLADPDGIRIPTFNTMWFSWANHHYKDDAVIWSAP